MGQRIETVIKTDGADMYKFGHIELLVTEEELRRYFEFGDILKVTIESIGSFLMPFCRYYDEVGIGDLVLCTYTKGSFAVIAKNYKSLGEELGILENNVEGGNFRLSNKAEQIKTVTIELESKAEEYVSLMNGHERGKYICDFRMVSGNGICDNVIFRSSSPVDGRLSDNKKADQQAREMGIQSVIDLADTKEEALQHPDYFGTYCSGCKTAFLNLPLNVTSDLFKRAIFTGITFIAESEPPYLVFCLEGRDRTGLFVALLQAMCGVELSRIVSDYTFSFKLLHEDKMNQLFFENAENFIKRNLCSILNVDCLRQETLQMDTERFLLSIGLKKKTIHEVKKKIGGMS